jgi:hypothetical protein
MIITILLLPLGHISFRKTSDTLFINSGMYTFCSKPLATLALTNLVFEERGSQIVKKYPTSN